MVRSSIKTITYSNRPKRTATSNNKVARAAAVLRKRMVGTPRAPLRTGGFYGVYNRRGRDELKFNDVNVQSTAVTNTGTVTLLNGIAQGTDYNQRIGRKVTLKSILFKVSMGMATGASSSSLGAANRFLVVYDAQANATAPAVTDILATANFMSPMNLNNRDRFKVLFEIVHCTGAYTKTTSLISAGDFYDTHESRYRKINLEEQFSGTGNTIGSIATGSIYVLQISDEGNGCIYDFYSRIRFTDS